MLSKCIKMPKYSFKRNSTVSATARIWNIPDLFFWTLPLLVRHNVHVHFDFLSDYIFLHSIKMWHAIYRHTLDFKTCLIFFEFFTYLIKRNIFKDSNPYKESTTSSNTIKNIAPKWNGREVNKLVCHNCNIF